jgi:acetoin utilization protein AcuB
VTVGDYMTKAPHTIGAEQTLKVARQLMHEHHVRHLPVLHGGDLVGVLSEREVESFEALPGSSLLTVEEAMVPDVYVTPRDAPLEAVAAEMARRRVGSAVIVNEQGGADGAGVVGVFTAVDALRALVDALKAPPATAG